MSWPKLPELLPTPVFEQVKVVQTKVRAVADILRPSQHVFYQSHMRAYTSLVSHILASNSEIAGYVELHRSYHHPADLVVMRQQIQTLAGAGIDRSKFKLDKLLHNGNSVGEQIAASPNVRLLFSLRHPAETLPSIVEMVKRTGERMAYQTPEGATEYYINRVQRLATEATKVANSFYFDAETIIDDTDRLLERLTTFLGLASPLQGNYDTFPQTGRMGAGDPSDNIRTGTILRDREQAPTEFPADLLAAAQDAYQAARHDLIRGCTITVTADGVRS